MQINDYVWHRHTWRYGRITAVNGMWVEVRHAYFNYDYDEGQWFVDDLTELRILRVHTVGFHVLLTLICKA